MDRKKKIWIGVGVGLVLIIAIGALASGPEEEESAPPPAAQTKPVAAATQPDPTATPIPAPAVTAVELYQERENNATRFDLNYKDKWVRITGTVGQVEDGDVRLVVDEESYRVLGSIFIEYIALQDLPREVQASAEKGQQFTATCKVGNYILGTMYLEDCSIQ